MKQEIEIKDLKPTKKDKEQKREEIIKLHDWYRIKWKKEGDEEVFSGIAIERVPFLNKLKSFGFYVYDVGIDQKKYVRIRDNVIKEVDTDYIINYWIRWVRLLPTNQDPGDQYSITAHYLEKKVIDSLEFLFKKILLRLLIPDKKIKLQVDTRMMKLFFFKNGFVSVTREQINFQSYNKNSEKYIWKDQILDRIYEPPDKKRSVFEDFCRRISGYKSEKDPDFDEKSYSKADFQQRFTALKTIIGYNLHNYTRGKRFATILTDSNMGYEGEANGRTGKTLFCKALGWILNTSEDGSVYCEISGRKFDIRDKHRYEKANLDTKLIHLNDLYNHFNIEHLFTDITEGIEAKKMYEAPFHIDPKIIISTNKTIKIDGESAKDRVIQFEFSDFFHSNRSPADYYGHWFFDDWDRQEWARFDRFIIECTLLYFRRGLIKPAEINLHRRSIIDHTDPDFFRWIEYKFRDYDDDGDLIPTDERIFINKADAEGQGGKLWRYNKKDLYQEFLSQYEDFKNKKFFDQKVFTRWLKYYIKNEFTGIEIQDQRSSGNDYILFFERKGPSK